jgi:hypothetical protein
MKRFVWILAAVALAACADSEAKKKAEGGEPAIIVVDGWAKADAKDAGDKAIDDASREAVATAVRTHLTPAVASASSTLITANLLSDTTRYIQGERVLAKVKDGDFIKVRLEAAVLFDRVGEDLKKLGILKRPSEEAAKTVLALYGPPTAFHVVSQTLEAHGFKLVRTSTDNFVNGNEPDGPRAAVLAKGARVKIVVVGKATASASGSMGAWDANVRLWFIDPDSAEMVDHFEAQGSANGPSEELAAAKALSEAGEIAAERAAAELARRLPKTEATIVKLFGVGPPEDLRSVMEKLRAEPGVQAVLLEAYSENNAALSVYVEHRTAEDLAADMLRDASFAFDIRSVLPNELELERRPP